MTKKIGGGPPARPGILSPGISSPGISSPGISSKEDEGRPAPNRGEGNPRVAVEDLPLQRIYWNERENAARILFTQPVRGTLREWDWATAVDEARRIAAYLKAQNWPPGSRIAILSKNCAWWIMADFAIWMAGHTSVPIFPSLRDTSVAGILDHSQPVACFVGLLERPPMVEGSPLNGLYRIAFPGAPSCEAAAHWEELLKQHEPVPESAVRGPMEIATIIYTSGTTGEPKGVMQTFQSLTLMADAMYPVLKGDGSADRILSYLPLAHIAERAIVEMNSLYLPLHIYFAESPETFLKDLERARPTIFFTVPRLLMRFQQGVLEKLTQKKITFLLRLPILGNKVRNRILIALALDKVRLAASGSAALPVDLLLWYRRLGLNLVEGYGMTETGITHVSLPEILRPGYVGTASPDAETRISKDGEIQIKGPMNLAGYYRNPALTAAAFSADGYFLTGDRGEIDDKGRLRIVGRLKEEFKTSKGKYVFPASIEQHLNAGGLFESVCVLGAGMTGPFAAVVLTAEKRQLAARPEGRMALEDELNHQLRQLNQHLDHHENLRFLAVVPQPWTIDNGFLTPTLKVRRSCVEDRFAPFFDTWQDAGKTVLWPEA